MDESEPDESIGLILRLSFEREIFQKRVCDQALHNTSYDFVKRNVGFDTLVTQVVDLKGSLL